jgi:pimeloyl-ACP methyl ester carboxylesterase
MLGELLQRRPSGPEQVLQLARLVGEEDTLPNHPHLIDLLVAIDQDPVASETLLDETRTILSPYALVSPTGWRHRMGVKPEELKQLVAPTLLVWGENDPIGGVEVAQTIAELIPDAQLEMLPAGHAPWLGYPDRIANLVADFVK